MNFISLLSLYLRIPTLFLFLMIPLLSNGQSYENLITEYLSGIASEKGLQPSDIASWEITDQYVTKHNGVTHVHIRQLWQGISVYHGVANFTIKDGRVVYLTERLQRQIAQRANSTQATISARQAIEKAAKALKLPEVRNLQQLEAPAPNQYIFSQGGISQEYIPVKLVFFPGPEGELSLAWDLSIATLDGKHWWSLRMDASDGKILDQKDWIVKCHFPDHSSKPHRHTRATRNQSSGTSGTNMLPGQYRVFPFTIESPNHGPHSLVSEPADMLASPYGWHDTNGAPGAEYTITRGNNVHASEDRDGDNAPGYSPDGGNNLIFDFPLNQNQPAAQYQDASITNLFYINNIMHDVFYHYGFDEQSGNFQENNYGRGGLENDYVNADGQDGSGSNNATFGTPPDGENPRMSMFLWTSGSGNTDLLTINSPSAIGGLYEGAEATFGPGVPTTPVTADLVLVDDASNPDPNDGCETFVNGASLNGKIALINRGNCQFVVKIQAAQDAGAVGVVMINNVGGGAINMGGASNTITIPSLMISQADGNTIKSQINNGNTVNVTIQNLNPSFPTDSDFDNGIMAHEYGHGISTRLTGGPAEADGLFNAEQMGEGWSDYFTLVLSLDTNVLNRGIGTFSIGESTTGGGIRPARYSSDFAVNPFTYAATNDASNISLPHGIGFVWCTMLWDLTQELIDIYGYDPDIYKGSGGNNIAIQLVMDGLKLQPINPGFVDGRDAILMADQINNGGANQCLIWEVFARRGLGYSASQGSTASRSDQVEAFDMPPVCLTPTTPPVAKATHELVGCGNKVFFTDQSGSIPQGWSWDFGDGSTDTLQNPAHTYQLSGVYQVRLIVNNSLGADTFDQTVSITFPPAPVVADVFSCEGESLTLQATAGAEYNWYETNGTLLGTGTSLAIGIINADTSFLVEENVIPAPQKVGPVDGSFSSGGYHNTGFTGTVNFTAKDEFTIISAWVDAGSAGQRTIMLWDNANAGGNIIDSVRVDIPAGEQRITLNLEVPGPGDYSIGGTAINLFRNDAGASYPYEIAGLVRLTGSSAGPDFYYYLYDLEVRGTHCISERTTLKVKVAEAAFSYTQNNAGLFNFSDISQGAINWSWSFGDGNTSNMQNPSHGYATQGSFPVTLTVNGTCIFTDTVVNTWATGLESIAEGLEVNLTPNPTDGFVWVSLNQALVEPLNLTLYSAEGREVSHQILEPGETQKGWNLGKLPQAVYLVRLYNRKGSHMVRLMVNK